MSQLRTLLDIPGCLNSVCYLLYCTVLLVKLPELSEPVSLCIKTASSHVK